MTKNMNDFDTLLELLASLDSVPLDAKERIEETLASNFPYFNDLDIDADGANILIDRHPPFPISCGDPRCCS